MFVDIITQPERECGMREDDAFYLSTPEPSQDGCLPAFSEMESPIPVNRKPHRGPLVVDGDAILARQPEEEWLVGSSADHLEKVKGDAWAIDTFGMTVTKRLATGECKGIKDPEAALVSLAGKIGWNERVFDSIRSLSQAKVAEMQSAALPFGQLIRSLQEHAYTQQSTCLVEAVAKTWALADSVPPSKRLEVIPHLTNILMLMGLPKDALAMRIQYK